MIGALLGLAAGYALGSPTHRHHHHTTRVVVRDAPRAPIALPPPKPYIACVPGHHNDVRVLDRRADPWSRQEIYSLDCGDCGHRANGYISRLAMLYGDERPVPKLVDDPACSCRLCRTTPEGMLR